MLSGYLLSLTFCISVIPADDNLDLLASLLEESEAAAKAGPEEDALGEAEAGYLDEYNELFDANDDDASYTEELDAGEGESGDPQESVEGLFGDVGDLLEEEEKETLQATPPSLPKEKTQEDLQGFSLSFFTLNC